MFKRECGNIGVKVKVNINVTSVNIRLAAHSQRRKRKIGDVAIGRTSANHGWAAYVADTAKYTEK